MKEIKEEKERMTGRKEEYEGMKEIKMSGDKECKKRS
jgi:hypothetical protein